VKRVKGKIIDLNNQEIANVKERGEMNKKINTLIISLILITYLAGCGRGSSSGGGGDKPVTNPAILTLLDNYKRAVEAYDVDGMLDCLDDSNGFSLTINEGSYTETKNYTQLEIELTEDGEKDKQQNWRKSPDDGGNGYVLDLVLGTPQSGNETSDGAIVKLTFEVYESATVPLISRFRSDSGNIVWTLAQNSGEWKAVKMVINYDTTTASSLAKSAAIATISQDKGFGFGKMEL
jgi:hypothetical protein